MTTTRAADRSARSVGLVIGSALVALIMLVAVLAQFPQNDGDSSLSPVQPTASASTSPRVTPTEPTVVSEHEMLHRSFRGLARVLTDDALGTALLFRSDDGGSYFVTNAHVVDGDDQPVVRTSDGIEQPAVVIGRDDEVDLAVLRITDLAGGEPLPMADSDLLEIAQPLYVIGYVLGGDLLGDPTVSHGIVSGRRVHQGVDYVQTDAVMNPGNSGGPVINVAGEVIGLATWGIREAGYEPITGINFAIPSNTIVTVAEAMIDHSNS
jgi:serine protease Do